MWQKVCKFVGQVSRFQQEYKKGEMRTQMVDLNNDAKQITK
jgi:hypothetical protein